MLFLDMYKVCILRGKVLNYMKVEIYGPPFELAGL